ncbi:DUF1565 domain-containing protein [Egbenema bharatensis]|uniref:DUF1565 domain-containing protein n=1 Tax=Egbenema bharatensis TaxID=3463334 RepID=UPI003A84974F
MRLRPPSHRFHCSAQSVLFFSIGVPWWFKVFSTTIGLGVFLILVSGSEQQAIAQTTPSAPESSTQSTASHLLFVNPIVGNNASGDGSQRSPFRTITHALQVAQPNTVIMLTPGTYSAETGEVFPLVMQPHVTIQGDPSQYGRGIVIRGGGTFLSPTSAGQNITLLGADQAQLLGVTVTNPNPRGYGLWVESSHPIVRGNTFTGNTHDGISTVGNSAPLIQNNRFTQNGANGITIFGRSQPEVRQNAFERTGFGINVAEQATPLVVDNQVSQNRIGVLVQGDAQPVLRGNRIEANREDGLTAISNAQPNLGTASDPGHNVFANNPVDLNANATSQTIPAHGNQLTGDRLQGEVDLAGTTPLASPPTPPANRFAAPAANSSESITELPPPAASNVQPAITELPPTPVVSVNAPPPAPATTATIEVAVPPPTPPVPRPALSPAPRPTVSTSSNLRPVAVRRPRSTHPSDIIHAANRIAPTEPIALEIPASPPSQLVSATQAPPLPTPSPQSRSSFNTPIDIPVPAPESSPSAPAAVASRNLPTPPPQMPQSDVLPVPEADIPVGNIGSLPTVNVSRNVAFRAGGGGGNTVSRAGLRYRVVVETSDERDQTHVQSIVPSAFRTSINGRSLIQVGAFSSRANAEQTVQTLSQSGLRAVIQEIE